MQQTPPAPRRRTRRNALSPRQSGNSGRGLQIGLTVAAMGVVFGDIGTSPLYAASTTFLVGVPAHGAPSKEYVYGATSTLVWALVVIVTVLYVRFLMRADNNGEGGLLALFGLLRRADARGRFLAAFTVVAIIGAAMFLGDSVITPAISVLSAVEGLEVVDPGLKRIVVPVSVVILIAVFIIQRFGTTVIGRLFGPVMLLWFTLLAVTGVSSIAQHPAVLQALSPHWVVLFFILQPQVGLIALGAIVLAVTGAEALYADLGHFGRPAISRAWLFVVFPALVANYLGQASLVIRHPGEAASSFFALVPSWGQLPMVVVATAATIIASQAVISGTYSVVHQATRLELFPPLRTIHTSADSEGQIYVPAINVLLAIAVLAVTIGFGGSAALASAYGIAVTATISITTFVYIAWTWVTTKRVTARLVITSLILLIALLFFVANLPKAASGGWLPLTIGAILVIVMATWWSGQRRVHAARARGELQLSELESLLSDDDRVLHRVPGDAVFITRNPTIVPMALRIMVTQNHALQERAILLSWSTASIPTTQQRKDRIAVTRLQHGVIRVTARVGYQESPQMVALLVEAAAIAPDAFERFDPDTALYFISTPVPRFNRSSRMFRWAQRLFLTLDRLAPDPLDVIALPRDRTTVFGREAPL